MVKAPIQSGFKHSFLAGTRAFFVATGFLGLGITSLSSPSYGQAIETDTTGGYSLGIGGGVAVSGSAHSVKINPALMSYFREYSMDFGYAWPEFGREFYTISVIDSMTSDVAVGAQYTGFKDKFKADSPYADRDTVANQRIALGFAKGFQGFSLGFAGQYVRKFDRRQEQELSRLMMTFGGSMNLSNALRIGISAENFGNKDFVDTNPLKYRLGASALLLSGNLSLQLEGLMKERPEELTATPGASTKTEMESWLTSSAIVRVRNVIRILGFYSHDLDREREQSRYGGGIGIGHKLYSINYMLARNTAKSGDQQISGINFRLNMSM